MSTERRQREGMLEVNGEQDPLVKALSKALSKCCDELGVVGCSSCPMRSRCCRLWRVGVEEAVGNGNLSLTAYRRLAQRFASLKMERDCTLRRKAPLLTTHKAADDALSHR